MPNYSYLYLAIKLEKCMMRNLCGLVRTQKTSTQKMSDSKMNNQNIPNLHVCSTDESR